MNTTPGRAARVMFLVVLVLAATFVSPLHLPLNNPNEGVRVYLAKAIVDDRSLSIDAVVEEFGYIDDKARMADGRLTSSKAPLPSLLAAAGYAAVRNISAPLAREPLTLVARFFGSTLPTLLLAMWLLMRLRHHRREGWAPELCVATLLLHTHVLAYSNTLSGHAIAALASAVAVAICATMSRTSANGTRDAFALGAVSALAAGAEYPAAITGLIACVACTLMCGWRGAGLFVLGATPVALLVAGVHTVAFGAPWRTGYSSLENVHYQKLVAPGVLGMATPQLHALWTCFFSVELGLFVFAPITLLGVTALAARHHRAPAAVRSQRFGLVALVLYAAFICTFVGFRGGWSVGPRYISELTGVLAVVAFFVWHQTRHFMACMAAAAAAGCVTATWSGQHFPHLPDTLKNPVRELVWPLFDLGVSAKTQLPIHVAPTTERTIAAVVVLLPLLCIAIATRQRRLWAGVAVGAMAAWLVLLLGPRSDAAHQALELRRMLDNFRPSNGVPTTTTPDVRDAFAVDRSRNAWPVLNAHDCSVPKRVVPHRVWSVVRDAALLRARLHDVVPRSLVVASNVHAARLLDLVDVPAIVVTIADLRTLRGPLPCRGDIITLDLTPDEARAVAQRSNDPQRRVFAR